MTGILEERRRKKAQKSADGPLNPIAETDFVRRVELLDSFERAGLGWFWASDALGRLIYLSETAIARLGIERDKVLGKPVGDLFRTRADEGTGEPERPLRFLLGARNSISQLCVKVSSGKSEYWWEIAGKPQFDKFGVFTGYRGSAKDVTATLEDQRDAERLSQFDALTGLANRHRMARTLTKTLTHYRNSKRSCALLMLDLDRFKQVNDTLGHPAGDDLLKQVAARLQRIIGDQGEIARLGGDEFQIMLPDFDDRGVLGDLGQRMIQIVSQPYSLNGSRATIGSSLGIAIAPYDGIEAEDLVNAADLALYAAKGSGRGKYRFFSSDLKDKSRRRAQVESDLGDALANEELEMHFQPIVDAETHKVKCLEALIRWRHPEKGWIPPGEFIPIAEEVGMIKKIGAWALRKTCEDAATWPVELRVAVNVSAVQFEDDSFPNIVQQAIEYSGINPARVELEITESIFVGDYGRSKAIFARLRKLGVRLALDDFGTGYSSLSYLRDAPFDKIKIDQSFVRGCTEPGNNNKAIISSIVSLAGALQMETVAEGVETRDELALVKELGAGSLQGLIFSPAVPNDELLERLDAGKLVYDPSGPPRYRAERRKEFRRVGLIHGDHRYNVTLRNLSKTGAMIEGLLNVPVGTDVVLDLGGGQLAVAAVRRSEGASQGLRFETRLIDDGDGGLCTRHRVSPYQIEAAGRPLTALGEDAFAVLHASGGAPAKARQFIEIDMNSVQSRVA
ncbi:MAG: diguanylate phosphodiesterase [Sphingomonadales bacterium BRH_c42]|nr:MAG: diguanylate phosphodiesterase [Sphingomonadales bacterium BRH_c42]